jgi:hypothetical protein
MKRMMRIKISLSLKVQNARDITVSNFELFLWQLVSPRATLLSTAAVIS